MPYFRNIIAIGHRGEHQNETSDSITIVSRLICHIQFLMNEAKEAHLALGAEQQNTITRLILNEYSLYPQRPLTLTEYKTIIAAISEYAQKLPDEVHIVVATLAVLWPADRPHKKILHNAGLYVQCGNNFRLHHFDKNLAFDDRDLSYGSKSLYGSRHANKNGFFVENYYDTYYAPKYLLNGTSVSIDDPNQFYGAIKLKIFDEDVIVVNEICFEHDNAIGLYYVRRLIEQLQNAQLSIPKLASHVIISNTIQVRESNQVGSAVHADPNSNDIKTAINKVIDNPIFGGPITLHYLQPEKIEPIYLNNFVRTDYSWRMSFPLRCNMNFLEIEEINRYLNREYNAEAVPLNELIKYLVVNNNYITFEALFDQHAINVTMDDHLPLRWAARLGHTEIVKLLLTSPTIEPAAKDNYAFRWACANGHTEIIEILLKSNQINPNMGIYNGLELACFNNQTAVVTLLLKDKSIDPYGNNNEAFLFAIQSGNLEAVKLFYDRGPRVVNDRQLKSALKQGHLEVIQFVVGDGKVWRKYLLESMSDIAKNHSKVLDYLMDVISKKENQSTFFKKAEENNTNNIISNSNFIMPT